MEDKEQVIESIESAESAVKKAVKGHEEYFRKILTRESFIELFGEELNSDRESQ